MITKSGLTAIAAFCLAMFLTTATARGQEKIDLTGQHVTVDQLIGILTPTVTRGIYPKDVKVKCGQYRGIKLVKPAADIAAIKVEFATGSAELTPAGEKTLGTLGEALRSDKLQPCCFQIGGYTDSTGRLSSNERLSRRRALSVIAYLTKDAGIDSERMMPQGYGPSNPIGDNNTPEGRAQNRRVEVVNAGYGSTSE